MKTSILLIFGAIAVASVLLVPSARADDQNLQYTERKGSRHHENGNYSRPYNFVFTPSAYYHEHPIVMYDEPVFANRYYMGPTLGFTFGFGGHPRHKTQAHPQ